MSEAEGGAELKSATEQEGKDMEELRARDGPLRQGWGSHLPCSQPMEGVQEQHSVLYIPNQLKG